MHGLPKETMTIEASIAAQAVLVVLTLVVVALRSWVRLRIENRKRLTLSDYFVWIGWFATLGWFICAVVSLNIQRSHPLKAPYTGTDSVAYLKTVFLSCYFFDVGLYFPKFSLVVFYLWLIPYGFRSLRVAAWVATGYTASACIASFLIDTFIAGDISDNWSLENQSYSTANSFTALIVNWVFNWSTDLFLFIFPFFIINCITQLRKRQKIALCGIFSLGAITLVISLARFIMFATSSSTTYTVDDTDANLWYTAEMCTANIVVSLPTLKSLIIRSTSANTSAYSDTSAYTRQKGPGTFSESVISGDDDIELFSSEMNITPTTTRSRSRGRSMSENEIRMTTVIDVERHDVHVL